MPDVRSVTVHLNASVDGYIRDMRRAGRETDRAFASSHANLAAANRELGITSQRFAQIDENGRRANTTMARYNTRARVAADQTSRLSGNLDQAARNLGDLNGSGRGSLVTTERNVQRAGREIDSMSGRAGLLAQALIVLGPAVVQIGALGIPAIAGLTNGFAAAVLGVGTAVLAFQGVGDTLKALNTAALDPTTQNLQKAQAALEQLSPAAQGFVLELRRMEPAFAALKGSAAAGLFPGLTAGLDALQGRLPIVEEILFRIGDTLGNLARDAGQSLGGPEWDAFLSFISREAPQALAAVGQAVGHLAHGLAGLWMAFAPLNHDFADVMVRAAGAFDQWASGLSKTQGFHEFIDYLRESGPRVADALAAIGDAVLQIVEASAPLGGPVLQAITAVARAVAVIADSKAGPAIMATVTALTLLNRGMKVFSGISDKPWVGAARGAETLTGKLAASRGALLRGGAALAGLGIAASGVGDKVGLTNTMSLALMGTLAGPWGAAVGGAVGLMIDLGKSHGYTSASSQDLQATLNQETGAITQNTRAYAANQLEKSGALRAAQALGLSLPDVTSAALGNSDALDRVNAGLDAAKAGFYDADGRIQVSAQTLNDYQGNLALVSGGIGDVSGKLDDAQSRQVRYAAATSDASSATRDQNAALRSNVAAFNRSTQAALAAFDAETQYRQALTDARKAAEKNNAGIRGNSTAAVDNRQKLSALAAAWNNQSEAVRNNLGRFAQARRDFIDTAHAMGVPRQAAVQLANKLLAIPTNIHIQVTALTGLALSALAQARRELDALNGRRATMYVTTIRTGAGGQGSGVYKPSARGNLFPTVRAYAYGDVANGHQPQLAGPGPVRVWREPETQGEAYVPLANDSRRPRAKAVLQETAGIFGGRVEWFARGGWSRPTPAAAPRPGGAGVERVVEQLPRGPVRLVVDGHEFTAYVEDVARGEIDGDRRFQTVRTGR